MGIFQSFITSAIIFSVKGRPCCAVECLTLLGEETQDTSARSCKSCIRALSAEVNVIAVISFKNTLSPQQNHLFSVPSEVCLILEKTRS